MHGHACDCGRPFPDFLPPGKPTCGHATCRAGVPCRQLPPPAPPLASHSQVGHVLTDADIERVAERVMQRIAIVLHLLAERLCK